LEAVRNTFLVLGLGIYKTAATYTGQPTAPTTLDWIIGILWALRVYWVSFLEEAELGPEGRWFFTHDVSGVLRPLLLFFISACVIGLIIWGFIDVSRLQQLLKVFLVLLAFFAFMGCFGCLCLRK